ncbi:MAG: hypothetical protein H6621_06835 [Halobacteriovoraceae bacterium]|nr:hypothetical protein [Halobacteriovoraceae bacterium]
METILGIFEQLAINGTVFIQLLVVFVIYFIGKFAFFGPLQNIIEERIEKTKKTETLARDLEDKVENLKAEYESKLEHTHKAVQQKKSEEKKKIEKEFEGLYRSNEEEINKKLEESKKKALEELEKQKLQILGQSKQLADDLVSKLQV